MLSEEEKKAIEKLNEILKEWQEIINIEDKTEREIEMSMYMEEMPFEEINTVLNLITKLQKELEKKEAILDKVIEKLKEDANKKIPLAEDMDWVRCRKEHAREILNIIEGDSTEELKQKESVLDKAKDMLVDLRAELKDDEYNYYAKEVTKILNIIREGDI